MTAVVLLVAAVAAVLVPVLQRDLARADQARRFREALRAVEAHRRATYPALYAMRDFGRAMERVGASLAKVARQFDRLFRPLRPPATIQHRWYSPADPRPCQCPGCRTDRARQA